MAEGDASSPLALQGEGWGEGRFPVSLRQATGEVANPSPSLRPTSARERGLALALPMSFPLQHPQAEYSLGVARLDLAP